MVRGSHNGNLLAENDDRTTDCDKDLAHDQISDAGAWVAEVDHETLTENIDWYGDEEKPAEVASLADDETD